MHAAVAPPAVPPPLLPVPEPDEFPPPLLAPLLLFAPLLLPPPPPLELAPPLDDSPPELEPPGLPPPLDPDEHAAGTANSTTIANVLFIESSQKTIGRTYRHHPSPSRTAKSPPPTSPGKIANPGQRSPPPRRHTHSRRAPRRARSHAHAPTMSEAKDFMKTPSSFDTYEGSPSCSP
jgi:hypothetical protein